MTIFFFHEIRYVFIALNTGIIWYLASEILPETSSSFYLGLGTGLASWGIHYVKDQCAQPKEKKTLDEVDIQETTTQAQEITKTLHLAKLILCGLAIFNGKNFFSSALTLGGTLYNYYKNHQIKWIQFDRKFSVGYDDRTSLGGFGLTLFSHRTFKVKGEVTASYKMLHLYPAANLAQNTCSICQEDTHPVDMGFCSSHVFHKDCFEKYVINRSKDFLKNASLRKTHVIETDQNHNRREYDKHHAVIPQENLPNCPNCCTYPEQNFIEITAPGCSSSTTLKNAQKPSLSQLPLETFYALYNIAVAGLSYLQQYPELTTLIFKVQCAFFFTDLAAHGATLYYLHQKIKELFKISEEHKVSYHAAFAITALALATLSYGISFKLRKLLDASSPTLEGFAHPNLKWGTPLVYTAMHCLAMNRIVVTLALSFFSKKYWSNGLSLLTQLFNVYHFSKLRWIKSTEFLKHDYTIPGLTLDPLRIHSFFLVPNSCIANPTHLKSVVSAIQEYGKTLLENTSLEIYYKSEFPTIPGYRASINNIKALIYKVKIEASHSLKCICSAPIALTNQVVSAANDKIGSVSAKILNYSGLLWSSLRMFPNQTP